MISLIFSWHNDVFVVVSITSSAFLYESVIRNQPDIVGIPMNPPIEQQIGLVWKKGIYINSSVEKFITYIQNR